MWFGLYLCNDSGCNYTDNHRYLCNYHLKLYPNSIAGRFVDMINKRETELIKSDALQFVATLVQRFDPSIQPSQYELVMHVRLGDVIEKSIHNVEEHLQTPLMADNCPVISQQLYIQPLSYFEDVQKQYQGSDIRQVTLVTGGSPPFQAKSYEYLNRIVEWWTERGKSVVVRTMQPEMFRASDADEDFVYMCRATHFVPSGGGFSKLASTIRPYL